MKGAAAAAEVRLSPRAVAAERSLQPKQRRKLAWWVDRLKLDVFAGDQIPKARIPRSLAARHGLPAPPGNAWRLELPLAFRVVYTIQSSVALGPVVLILEVLSHKEYDRLFGYR
ncbi:MAG TPA: hypothetical protein VJ397_07125 [Thermoplasmata archaeon]|nr:hypothetical protein [Thermoplasmata archaeon]